MTWKAKVPQQKQHLGSEKVAKSFTTPDNSSSLSTKVHNTARVWRKRMWAPRSTTHLQWRLRYRGNGNNHCVGVWSQQFAQPTAVSLQHPSPTWRTAKVTFDKTLNRGQKQSGAGDHSPFCILLLEVTENSKCFLSADTPLPFSQFLKNFPGETERFTGAWGLSC